MICISIDPALAKLGVNLQHKWTWKLSLSRWLLTTIDAGWKTIDNPDLLIRWKSTNDHVDDKWVEIWNKGETWLTVFSLTFLTLSSALPCFLLFFPISLTLGSHRPTIRTVQGIVMSRASLMWSHIFTIFVTAVSAWFKWSKEMLHKTQ